MLSGWTITRSLGCPICMEQTKTFRLKHSHKVSYFLLSSSISPTRSFVKKKQKFFQEKTSHPPPRLSSPDMWKRVAHLPFSYDLQEEEQEILGYGVQHN
ncbi:hypothetical protein CR513_16696, partial [Mucuna pruriens]